MGGVGEAIVSPIISLAINGAASFAAKEFAKLFGLEEKIQTLTGKLSMIKGFLADAETKQTENKAVECWLRDLKDAAYELEDLLEECNTEAALRPEGLVTEVDQKAKARWTKRARDSFYLLSDCFMSYCISNPTPVSFRREMADKLKSIEERLEKVNKEKSSFNLVELGTRPHETTVRPNREIGPLREEGSLFVGREKKMMEIKKEMLAFVNNHESSSTTSGGVSCKSKIRVIAIVGFGGLGKTTLAQAIFNDEEVKKCFTMREWVFVGEDFDAKRLIKDIIRDKDTTRLHDLQESLKQKVSGHKFLIILDDIWNSNPRDWEELWVPLTQVMEGRGVIIVTTRSRVVAMTKGPPSLHELGRLPDDQCWMILKKRAFKGVSSKQYPRQEELGKRIVKKLEGVPLAASMIGGFLGMYLHDEEKWEWVLNSTTWPETQEGDLVDQVVDLSFQHLPPRLKLCFSYCAVFPKDFRFDKEGLVHMWIAQNYVESLQGRRLEDVGADYFDHLHHSSFFQFIEDTYVMHDIIHDYAQKVLKEGCHITEQTDCTWSKDSELRQVRHLLCDTSQVAEAEKKLRNFKKLRTLRLSCGQGSASQLGVLADFKYLRVLELSGYQISELPESIKSLKLLKYLDITGTRI